MSVIKPIERGLPEKTPTQSSPASASWLGPHLESERLAIAADLARRSNEGALADRLYEQAAKQEECAFALIPADRRRTRGIVSVSVVSLYFKAGCDTSAKSRIDQYLARGDLPAFAVNELREIHSHI